MIVTWIHEQYWYAKLNLKLVNPSSICNIGDKTTFIFPKTSTLQAVLSIGHRLEQIMSGLEQIMSGHPDIVQRTIIPVSLRNQIYQIS